MALTILEGSTFCVSDELGDISEPTMGLFAHDTRFLSRWILTINGARPLQLSSRKVEYYSAAFFLRNPVVDDLEKVLGRRPPRSLAARYPFRGHRRRRRKPGRHCRHREHLHAGRRRASDQVRRRNVRRRAKRGRRGERRPRALFRRRGHDCS